VNHARNIGVQSSSGKYILLCDADDQVNEGWLAAMSEAFTSGAKLVGGRLVRVTSEQRPVGVPDDGLRNDLDYLQWPQGANCGFSRAVYDELGGFDEGYARGGDETDFFWRGQLRGHALRLVPAAAIMYTEKSAPRRRFFQYYHYGRSHVQLFRAFARQACRARPTSGRCGRGSRSSGGLWPGYAPRNGGGLRSRISGSGAAELPGRSSSASGTPERLAHHCWRDTSTESPSVIRPARVGVCSNRV
jgi:glycosyltransferase involved in cell wall biosynthesis